MRIGVASIVGLLGTVGCAQLLSYDDYQPRSDAPDAFVDATGDATDAATDADAGEPPVRLPARPSGPTMASGKGKSIWVAVRRFRLGSVDLDHVGPNENAWMSIGYDLDGRCTTAADSKTSAGTCKRPMTSAEDSLADGYGCRDNNFGHYIGNMIRGTAVSTETLLNDRVDAGARTWVLHIEDADTGDDAYAPAVLYGVRDERPFGTTLHWDGTDVRVATDDAVEGGDLGKPLVRFPGGYIAGDRWISGDPSEFTVILPITNLYLAPIHVVHGAMTLRLEPDRTTGHDGVLAGALSKDAFTAMMKAIAGYAGFCPGSALYENVLASATNAVDVSTGAPDLQDTSQPCDGLSLGMGIDTQAVLPVTTVAPPKPPPADPCADAGTDAAAD